MVGRFAPFKRFFCFLVWGVACYEFGKQKRLERKSNLAFVDRLLEFGSSQAEAPAPAHLREQPRSCSQKQLTLRERRHPSSIILDEGGVSRVAKSLVGASEHAWDVSVYTRACEAFVHVLLTLPAFPPLPLPAPSAPISLTHCRSLALYTLLPACVHARASPDEQRHTHTPLARTPPHHQVIFGTFRIAQVREPYSIVRYAADRCWPPLDKVRCDTPYLDSTFTTPVNLWTRPVCTSHDL